MGNKVSSNLKMETAGSETFVPGCLTMWHQILMRKKKIQQNLKFWCLKWTEHRNFIEFSWEGLIFVTVLFLLGSHTNPAKILVCWWHVILVQNEVSLWWKKSNKMQQLRFLFAVALLYMFRVTISFIIRSTMLYMATGELAHLGCY